MLFQLSACGLANKAQKAANKIKTGVSSAANSVSNWYKSLNMDRFEEGWDTAVKFAGNVYATAVSADYVAQVGSAINDLKVSMNSAEGSARGIAQEAGFVAEKWASGTFNTNAAASGSEYSTDVPNSHALGSADVTTNWGEEYSLKYYDIARDGAQAQAESMIEAYRDYCSGSKNPISFDEYMTKKGYDPNTQDALLASIYEGQVRIIPPEQMAEATAYLQGRIDKLSAIDGDVASARTKTYQETLSNLRDRIEAPDGTQSTELSAADAKAIAELSQEGEFKPEDFGYSVTEVIAPKYVVKQAIGTGAEVALLRTVFTVGPDLVSLVVEALKEGDVDEKQLKELGIEGAINAAEGFVEGSVSSTVVTLCKSGALGEALKSAQPNIVGALVFLTIEAMIAGYSVVNGDITLEQYGAIMADRTMITMLDIPTTMAIMAILPATKLFMLVGGLVGCILAATGYTIGKESVIAFVDGGGFEAFVPEEKANPLKTLSATVASMNLKDELSDLKDHSVTTLSSGLIKIKSVKKK